MDKCAPARGPVRIVRSQLVRQGLGLDVIAQPFDFVHVEDLRLHRLVDEARLKVTYDAKEVSVPVKWKRTLALSINGCLSRFIKGGCSGNRV